MTGRTTTTATALAERWGVSTTMIYDMLHAGELPGFRLGGKLWRIKIADVEEYEARPTAGPTRTLATDIMLEKGEIPVELKDHRTQMRMARLTGGD